MFQQFTSHEPISQISINFHVALKGREIKIQGWVLDVQQILDENTEAQLRGFTKVSAIYGPMTEKNIL